MSYRKICTLVFLFFCASAFANHGPGTSGGGSATSSGETMKQGGAEVTFRLDYTQFEDITKTEAARLARKGGEFDALNNSLVATVEGAYGITNDFQLGATIGYYWGSGFLDAESKNGVDVEESTADPEGMTDL